MRVNGWYLKAGAIAAAIVASWVSPYFEPPRPLALGIVATRPMAASHKISADDLAFAFLSTSLADDAVESPDGAAGACTTAALKKDEPIVWRRLTPPGDGDDSCADAALAISLADRIAKIPAVRSTAAATIGGTSTQAGNSANPASGGGSQPADWVQLFEHPPREIDAAARSAIGEFRSEFIKEFGKHLADNAADRIFGRDPRPEAAKPDTPKPEPSKPDTPKPDVPPQAKGEPLRLAHISYFATGRNALDPNERKTLIDFANDVRRHADCRIAVDAFADRTGGDRTDGQMRNLWLSWLRGNAVAAILVEHGIERQRISVAAHGDDTQAVGSPAAQPAALNRRAETGAVCAASEAVARPQ
jgi:outer membrane protein OmpA-like peptidoglycan-associated protein